MTNEFGLTAAMIREAFEEEIAGLGGRVTGIHADGPVLYARSVMPRTLAVGTRDYVQGGVALRAGEGGPHQGLCVRPYVFRQVCSNGTIMARALEAWTLEQTENRDPDEVVIELREAIRSCGSLDAFKNAAERMRSARDIPADQEVMMAAHLETHGVTGQRLIEMLRRFGEQGERSQTAVLMRAMGSWAQGRELIEMLERFWREGDPSRFGLMNAVTSVARDTAEPQRRWELEEMGGELAALGPGRPRRPAGARHVEPGAVQV